MRQWFKQKISLCSSKGRKKFGRSVEDELMWGVDLKPHTVGEYSIAVVQANSVLEDQSQVVVSPSATFVGVYDGHGGPEASRFVRNHLVPHINQFAREEGGGITAEVIRKAFNATEEGFVHLVKQAMTSRPQVASVGTCCLFGAISNDLLYVANLGDSRVVLGRRGGDCNVAAERLSIDHNVGVEEVRQEVKALHPDDAHIVICCRGVWRIKGIIQVSRSIGDVYLKKPEFQTGYYPISLKRPVLSAEPSIHVRKLKPEDLFLIFASDGLWEQLSDEEAVNIVSRSPRAGVAKRLIKAALVEAAKKKEMRYSELQEIPRGARRQFHDDITVVVVYLDHHEHKSSLNHKLQHNFNTHFTAPPVDIFSSNSSVAEEPDISSV